MSNYTKLVESRFFRNIQAEFRLAQNMLKLHMPFDLDDIGIKTDKDYNRSLYDFYIYELDCVDDFKLAVNNPEIINYIQSDYIILFFGRKKKLIDESIMVTHFINGDIPFYRGKHKVDNHYIHTAMIDTRFIIPPYTTN